MVDVDALDGECDNALDWMVGQGHGMALRASF